VICDPGPDVWYRASRAHPVTKCCGRDDISRPALASHGLAEFRLRPKGPRGISQGCITLEYRSEFDALRAYLLAQPIAYIPYTMTRTYGTVDVGFLTDTLDQGYRLGGSGTTRTA